MTSYYCLLVILASFLCNYTLSLGALFIIYFYTTTRNIIKGKKHKPPAKLNLKRTHTKQYSIQISLHVFRKGKKFQTKTIVFANSSALLRPKNFSTMDRANSMEVPGPWLVIRFPSTTTRLLLSDLSDNFSNIAGQHVAFFPYIQSKNRHLFKTNQNIKLTLEMR